MAEVVLSKAVTGGRKISREKNSVCLGSGQRVVSRNSSSETPLDARRFRFFYLWGFARGWYLFLLFSLRCGQHLRAHSVYAMMNWCMASFKEAVIGVCMYL
jgi:hypothetical protein